jgi:hypothetical protein
MAQRNLLHAHTPSSRRPLIQTTDNQHGPQAVRRVPDLTSSALVASGQRTRRDLVPSASHLLQLQRTHGNRYVQRLVQQARQQHAAQEQPSRPLVVQPTHIVTPANDPYEQEADRIATQVRHTLQASSAPLHPHDETLPLHAAVAAASQQTLPIPIPLQRQSWDGLTGATVGPEVEASLQQARGGGQALPTPVRQPMERAFGMDFRGVRLHTDGQADALNHALQARAFISGQDIFLSRGEYNPGSPAGQELLAHELTHVVQQRGQVLVPTIQRKIGLELEFPIPVDPLGELTEEQQELLTQPLDGENGQKRQSLHKSAVMDKDTTVFEKRIKRKEGQQDLGFKIVPDHQSSLLNALWQHTPAYGISYNVLECVFNPPVESSLELENTIDLIYNKIDKIYKLTNDLTERKQLNGDFYVGPINTTGKKPKVLDKNANSLQVNIGVEPQKIPDLFLSYAQTSSDLEGEELAELKERYRGFLSQAVTVAVELEKIARKKAKVESPLLGLRGLFAIMALYSLAGAEGSRARGSTIKNFTPLLLKTPLSALAERALTPEEGGLYKLHKEEYLQAIVGVTRGKEATLDELLVKDTKGKKTDVKVGDLITDEYKAPFIVSGKAIFPDPVGPPRNESDPSVDTSPRGKNRRRGAIFETRIANGSFDRASAKQRANEMFFRTEILHHQIEDTDLVSDLGQSARVQEALEVIKQFK